MKLLSAHFIESITLLGERTSCAPGLHGCKSILPAKMLADGTAQPVDKEAPHGLLIVEESGRGERRSVFVPMANVRFLQYGEEPKAK